MATIFGMGFIPEPENPKHWSFEQKLMGAVPHSLVADSPTDIDLSPYSFSRHNQKSTNSCAAQAIIKALEIKRVIKYGMMAHKDLSTLSPYYLAREQMYPSMIHSDTGTYISSVCDVVRKFGACSDLDWPFNPAKVLDSPSWTAMQGAYLHKISSFYKITATGEARLVSILECLGKGHPVVFGTRVGKDWFRYVKGQVLNPPLADYVGRHATVLVGYRDGLFLGENSWGANWGDNGFYQMTPEYVKWDCSSDFWAIMAPWEGV